MSRLLLSQLEKTHLHILDHLPCDSPRTCSVPKHERQQSRGALTSTNLLICLGLFGRGPGCLLTSSDIRKGAFTSPKAEMQDHHQPGPRNDPKALYFCLIPLQGGAALGAFPTPCSRKNKQPLARLHCCSILHVRATLAAPLACSRVTSS